MSTLVERVRVQGRKQKTISPVDGVNKDNGK